MVMWHQLGDGKPYSYKDNFYLLAPDMQGDNWSMDYFQRMVTSKVWCPCSLSKGVRLESGFIASAVCALDFDTPRTTLEWAISEFYKYEHIIGTTKSHQKEKNGITCDRFRVILFWDKLIVNLSEYKHNMRLMITRYGADAACSDGARFFYPCQEIVASDNGLMVHAEPLPVVPVKVLRRNKLRYAMQDMPAPEGQRNTATFAAACKFIRLGLDDNDILDRITFISNGLSTKEIETIFRHAKAQQIKNPGTDPLG